MLREACWPDWPTARLREPGLREGSHHSDQNGSGAYPVCENNVVHAEYPIPPGSLELWHLQAAGACGTGHVNTGPWALTRWMLHACPPNSVLEETRARLPLTRCPAPFPAAGINQSPEQDHVRSLGPPRRSAPVGGRGVHLETQMCRTKFIIGDKGHHQTRSTFPCKVTTKGNLVKATRIFTVDCVLEHLLLSGG